MTGFPFSEIQPTGVQFFRFVDSQHALVQRQIEKVCTRTANECWPTLSKRQREAYVDATLRAIHGVTGKISIAKLDGKIISFAGN